MKFDDESGATHCMVFPMKNRFPNLGDKRRSFRVILNTSNQALFFESYSLLLFMVLPDNCSCSVKRKAVHPDDWNLALFGTTRIDESSRMTTEERNRAKTYM